MNKIHGHKATALKGFKTSVVVIPGRNVTKVIYRSPTGVLIALPIAVQTFTIIAVGSAGVILSNLVSAKLVDVNIIRAGSVK